MRSDFYSLPYAAQQAIRRGERDKYRAARADTDIEALEQRVSELEEALQEAVSYQQEAVSYHDGPTYAWILRAKQVLAKALNREPNP
jgi:hypothetical protein